MLQLAIAGELSLRLVDVVEGELTFGRAGQNDIVLAGSEVSPRHARLIVRGARLTIADLASDNGTWLNGARLAEPHLLVAGDRIQIGHYAITLNSMSTRITPKQQPPPRPFVPRDPTEAQLLAQIASREPGSREVYADWLDDRELSRDAEFVRAQDELVQLRVGTTKAHGARTAEVGALAAELSFAWCRHVGRNPIERCAPEFAFRCPKEWGALAPTEDPGVRYCSGCAKPVYYAASVAEARERAANHECVALDLSASRRDRDLDAPYGRACPTCNFISGRHGAPACVRCGAEISYAPTMVGMIA